NALPYNFACVRTKLDFATARKSKENAFHPPAFVYHAALQNGDADAGGWCEPDSGPKPVATPTAAPRDDAGLRPWSVFLRNAAARPAPASDFVAVDVAAGGLAD